MLLLCVLCQPVERDSNEATLIIVHVREHHFTTYTLKATNDIGSATYQLVLRKSVTSEPPLWPPGRIDSRTNPQGQRHKPGYNQYSFIHSFIHLENLYSATSRKLLRGASSPTTAYNG